MQRFYILQFGRNALCRSGRLNRFIHTSVSKRGGAGEACSQAWCPPGVSTWSTAVRRTCK